MTDFWLVAAGVAAVAGLWIAWPFLGRRTIETNAAEGAISIYRDQMVEVDRDTAQLKILKYVVVHDCGTVINPMIVEGQIHGGVAHGIGNAFYEQLVFDEGAQLMNASFMDYLLYRKPLCI